MTIIEHPDWPLLLPWLRLEPTLQSRWRRELHAPDDKALLRRLLAIRCTCARCDRRMKPLRLRRQWRTWNFRMTCGSNSCRNSRPARAMAKIVNAAILGTPRAWQGRLFDSLEAAQPDTKNL